jgi:hypothetical protein
LFELREEGEEEMSEERNNEHIESSDTDENQTHIDSDMNEIDEIQQNSQVQDEIQQESASEPNTQTSEPIEQVKDPQEVIQVVEQQQNESENEETIRISRMSIDSQTDLIDHENFDDFRESAPTPMYVSSSRRVFDKYMRLFQEMSVTDSLKEIQHDYFSLYPLKKFFRLAKTDLLAGITVGLVSLPLSICFAISSSGHPMMGIMTAIFAGLTHSLIGGSKV